MSRRETTKDRVLRLLESAGGACISGAQIAAELQISRTAVWKAINTLREEGWQIDAATNKGYALAAENDVLSISRILLLLNEKAAGFSAQMQLLSAPDSTNQTAKALALEGAPHGTVLLADRQQNGRGRRGHSFFSPSGGLYMSMILLPEHYRFVRTEAYMAFAAVAVCAAIESVCRLSPQIKPVNDILLGGKKICGILTEAVADLESGDLGWIVLGIGINVRTAPEDFPPELREIAGSLRESRVSGLRCRLAAELMNRILGSEPPQEEALFADYRARLIP